MAAGTRRLVDLAAKRVTDEWGRAYSELGPRFQRALLAESILYVAASQDETVSDYIVRDIVDDGWARLVEVGE